MTATFHLPAAEFAALASGHGGVPAIRLLRSAQLSKHLLLTSHVVRPHLHRDTRLRKAWDVLSAARRQAPEAVSRLLTRPWVGAWAAGCVRATPPGPTPAELSHLGGIAAVAALRAGLDVELDLVVPGDGRVVLPTLGVAIVNTAPDGVVRVDVKNAAVVVHHGGGRVSVPGDPRGDGEGWLGMRRLELVSDGHRLRLCFDDLDPYRDCYRMTAAQRMPAWEVSHWRELFRAAWTLLVRHLPRRAEELSWGLQAAVPLAEGEGDPGLSATSRDAFGAFALNRPRSAAALAATLVHEFQHSKLNAVIDLVPLLDRSDDRLYHAPWRVDARPIDALLQGTYAFLGVTDVWRAFSALPFDVEADDPRSIFALTREQMEYVLPQLAGSGQLTLAGQRFVDGMSTALGRMPVDET